MTSTDTAQQLQRQITDGVAALTRDRQWVALLELTARTGSRYSLGNLILIGAQRPVPPAPGTGRGARRAAGPPRRTRHPHPAPSSVANPHNPTTTHDQPTGQAGPGTGQGTSGPARPPQRRNRSAHRVGKVVGFRAVVVFDIAQTDGPPLPGDTAIDGYTPHGLRDALTGQINGFGYQVRVGDCRPAFGVTRRADRNDDPARPTACQTCLPRPELATGPRAPPRTAPVNAVRRSQPNRRPSWPPPPG
jgi:hypothetical protein